MRKKSVSDRQAVLEKKTSMIRILETGPRSPFTSSGFLRSGEIVLGLYNYDTVVGLQARKSHGLRLVLSFKREIVIPEPGDRFIYIELKKEPRHERGDLVYIEIISIFEPCAPGDLPEIGYLDSQYLGAHKASFFEYAFRIGYDPDLELRVLPLWVRSDVREAIKALVSGNDPNAPRRAK